jgi:2-iminobutanoate/2-iminopropanoate deaminase
MNIMADSLPLSRVTQAGQMIFTSGQLGRGPDGQIVAGGFANQARQALENLRAAVESTGCNLADVVKTTVWLTDRAYNAEFNMVYREFFADPFPARSVVISDLAAPEAMIEIEAIAWQEK